MNELEMKRIEKVKTEAGLVDIEFPPCCLSCTKVNEDVDYCNKLDIFIDNPFQICKYYAD